MTSMKKHLYFFILLGNLTTFSQSESTSLRIFSFSEVEQLHQKTPKPIVVFTYTDWCKICHAMKTTTLHNEKVIHLLNDSFYLIMLNGEKKEDIVWFGRKFKYKPNGTNTGTHELTAALASIQGKISYPTTTILNSKIEIDLQIGSYIASKSMQEILTKYISRKD